MKKEITLSDMTLTWTISDEKKVDWSVVPSQCVNEQVLPREGIKDTEDSPHIEKFSKIKLRQPQCPIDVYRATDAQEANTAGSTLRLGATCDLLRFFDQRVKTEGDKTTIQTEFTTNDGLTAIQHIEHQKGWDCFRTWTELRNTSAKAMDIDYVSSALLDNITPYAADDAPHRLKLHRFQAGWSSEGRHLGQYLEDIELERCWVPFNIKVERFGQLGSKPTQRWMPWVGIQDCEADVTWAMHHEALGSWQAEVIRRNDSVGISIGPGDRQFAQRQVVLKPGESHSTEATWVTTCRGDEQDASARLVAAQEHQKPAPIDAELPIIFNEWCSTWGDPSHDNLVAMADRLKGTPCRFLVIDAGWYKAPNGSKWTNAQGDWLFNPELFPDGLKATCDAIRERGLTPGLWFEFEVVCPDASMFNSIDRLLTRGGHPIQAGNRRFLDLRQQNNIDFLEERMLNLIDECQLGYIKIDYNANIGEGVDGPQSPGENLAHHLAGTVKVFKRLRERFPELVIENCASGGQRLTPLYSRMADMHSFSDAHTCADIPVIAANVQTVIPAKQSQIWAVLLAKEKPQRIGYSLAATFLGRMCLSGDIVNLGDQAWTLTKQAMALYREVWPILKDGSSRRFGGWTSAMRKLRGWQAVVRSDINDQTLVVIHAFGEETTPDPIVIPAGVSLKSQFGVDAPSVKIVDGALVIGTMKPWTGCVFHLG